jgi:hypothetical protein
MKHAAAAKRLQRRRTKEDAHVAALTLAVHAADAVLATIESIMTSTTRMAMSKSMISRRPRRTARRFHLTMISSLCAVIGCDEPFTPGENDLPMATEEGVKPHVMEDAVESIVEDDDAAFAGLSKKAKKMRPQQMKSQAALNHGFVADRNIIVADYAMCDVDVSENEGEVGEGESSTTPQRSKANRR